MKNYDVLIIGGGASGLTCAISAKRKNKNLNIAILEHNNKIGKKLLATGNGRCNLTNMNMRKNNFHGSFKIDTVLERYSPNKLIEFFDSMGLVCKAEENGLVYPFSKQASAVLEILKLECNRLGIDIICEECVKNIKKSGKGFTVISNNTYNCKKVVLCCGGKASPECGGSGVGLDLAKNLGHKIVTTTPSLCPVEVFDKNIKSLKGVRASATVTLYDGNTEIHSEVGEVQFTDTALSGICIFNLCSYIKNCVEPNIKVSILNISFNELLTTLKNRRNIFKNDSAENLLIGYFNSKIAVYFLKQSKIDLTKKANDISDLELKQLANIILNWNFKCKKPTDFKKAQVMAGGVLGSEINENTMESKIVKGLYLCGELIDINGDCGGYNLHFAFSSGIIAGENL